MNSGRTNVLVLRQGVHGIPVAEYADELRRRLPECNVRLARTPDEERRFVTSARVVSSLGIDDTLLTEADDLELFAGIAAGYDHLPLERFAEMEVAVTNASGIHAPNVAEQVLAYILSFTRRLGEGRRRQERREWRHYQGDELMSSTVTIVGLGSIGTAVAQRLEGFDVETIGVRHTPSKGGPTDEVIGFDDADLHAALARTEYLVVASPLTDTTRNLIGTAEFETLPQSAFLVNVGRGPIVNTDALVAAIRRNSIDGAALDVTDPEPLPSDHDLWAFENVWITPHNAGYSPKHWERLADIVAGNVTHLLDGTDVKNLENVVQLPDHG